MLTFLLATMTLSTFWHHHVHTFISANEVNIGILTAWYIISYQNVTQKTINKHTCFPQPLKKAYFLEYAFHQLHECNLVTVRLFFLTACMLDFEYNFFSYFRYSSEKFFFDIDIKWYQEWLNICHFIKILPWV